MSSSVLSTLSSFSNDLANLVERTVGGVVSIKAGAYRTASGVVLGNGIIAVADHVLRREDHIPVQTYDGTTGVATVLGRDPGIDVAFLKPEGIRSTPFEGIDPAALKVGILAAIVGLTTDVGPSVSLGSIGALGASRRTWRGGTLDRFIRLDVNLYPSQVGAAVIDTQGLLIGLATPALLRHSSVAVPIQTLNRISDELLTKGRIQRGYLGVGLQPIIIPAALRAKFSGNPEYGLIVLSIEEDSPAAKANFQLGDILVALDGNPVGNTEGLQALLRGGIIGRVMTASLIRGGEPIDVALMIEERPGGTRRADARDVR